MNLYEISISSVNFTPLILSSSVCIDGYEAENALNGQGFMAERFVKPPVDLFIDFGFSFSVHQMDFLPCVGGQKSSGIEIYSATYLSGPQQQPQRPSCLQDFQNIPFRRLSRVIDNQKLKLSFCNLRRNGGTLNEGQWPDQDLCELRNAASCATDVVDCLRIRIIRTHSGTLPCLKNLVIIGEPNWRYLNPDLRADLKQAMRADFIRRQPVTEPSIAPPTQQKTTGLTILQEASRVSKEAAGAQVPDEFLDALTWQVMAVPVLLPSGHNLDLSTLEKYEQEEAKWGRPPNDPFTNVPFDKAIKAVPNIGLKSRIDQFLSRQKVVEAFVPRVLGSKIGNQTDDKQMPFGSSLQFAIRHGSYLLRGNEATTARDGVNSLKLLKPSGIHLCDKSDQILKEGTVGGEVPDDKRSNYSSDSSQISLNASSNDEMEKPKRMKLHEDRLRDSLDMELEKILGKSKRTKSTNHAHCLNCGLAVSGQRYKFPCEHFLCPPCMALVDQSSLRCSECQTAFNRSLVSLSHR